MIRFFRLVLVVLVLCVVAMLSAVVTMRLAIHGSEVSVPDFRGMTTAEAMRKAASLDLNLSIDNHFYSAEMPADHILAQVPAAGTIVRPEWHVRATQSIGPQRIAIPNVLGQPERSATISIRRAGLDLGNVAHMPYTDATSGTVIAQNPAPDAEGVERPSLSLLVADGNVPNSSGVVMPDLTGQQLIAATAAITHAGLKLAPTLSQPAAIQAVPAPGSPQPPASPIVPGTVLSQTPLPGYRIDANTPVQLTVAR